MVDKDAVRVLGRPAFHDIALTSSGELSYLGQQWRRDIAFAGYNVPIQVRMACPLHAVVVTLARCSFLGDSRKQIAQIAQNVLWLLCLVVTWVCIASPQSPTKCRAVALSSCPPKSSASAACKWPAALAWI